MDLKGLFSHLRSKWRRYLVLIVILLLLPFFIVKIKGVIEIRSEKWILEYLNKNLKLDIAWDGWRLDLVSWNLNINGLRIKSIEADMSPFWIFAERIELFVNPFPFFKDKTIDIRSIKIEDMRGNLAISGPGWLNELKSLILISSENNMKGKTKGGVSVRLGQLFLDGKDLFVDLPMRRSNMMIKDFILFLGQLDKKGPYPVHFNFKDGECNWKGFHRFMQSGKLKGAFSSQGIYVESFHVGFPEEGELNWRGDVLKGADGITFEGKYSGVLYSDTLAQFLKPFRQMKGRVASKGNIGGRWKRLKIEGDLEASEFSWRMFDFTEVKGRFDYHKGMLGFKDMKGQWKDGFIEIESQIALRDRKARVDIHFDRVPSKSFFKDWSKIFPGAILLCTGDMEWDITWPERIMKSEGLLQMDVPLAVSGKYPDKMLFIQSRFRSHKKLLFLDDLDLILQDNHIHANGQYDFSDKQIKLDYTCIIKERDIISRIWGFPFKGSGKLTGSMSDLLFQPRFTGRMEGEDIYLKDYHLDTVVMDYEYHKKGLDLSNITGRLKGGTRIEGKGNVIFINRSGPPNLDFLWSVKGLPLSEIASVSPYKPGFPYQGRVSGEGDLKLTEDRFSSKGSFNGRDITLFGQPAMDIEALYEARHGRVSLKNIKVSRGNGLISGDLSFDKEKGLSVKGDASGWEVYTIQLSKERQLHVKGVLDLNLSGGLQGMRGRFRIQDLSFKDKGALDISGNINLKGDTLRASVRHPWGKADSELNLKGDLPFKVKSACDSLSIFDPKTGLIIPNKGYSLLLNGNLEIQGLLKKGLGSIEGRFEGRDLTFSGPTGKFENLDGYELIIKDKGIFTPALPLHWEKGTLAFKGYWKPPKGVDLNVTGLVPLDILQDKLPDLKGLNGNVELDININGTISDPLMRGDINVSEGGFLLPGYNFRVDNIKGNIRLEGKSAHISTLTGATRGSGSIGLKGIVSFAGRKIDSFDLTAEFNDLYIYKRDVYKAFLDGQLEWAGRSDSAMLTGEVLVKEARHYDYRDIIQHIFAKKREVETDDLLDEGIRKNLFKWLEITRINIGLDLGEGFRLRSPFYNSILTGNLSIKGNLINPWLDGDIEAKEGEIIIGSQRFSLASGKIKLTNPELSEPTITALALKDINSYRLRLSIFGPLNKPNLQFSSTPYLSQPEILNMVFFGLTTEEEGRGQEHGGIISLMLSTTSSVLNDILGDEISHYTGLGMMRLNYLPQDLFRLDILDVELEEEGGGVERLTLGKTLSNRLKIKYSHLKGEEQREIAEAEYMITDHLTLIGAQDDQGTYSLDLNIGLPF